MRTVVFLGLIYIGDAIGKPPYTVEDNVTVEVMAVVFLCVVVMDIVDFLRNKQ